MASEDWDLGMDARKTDRGISEEAGKAAKVI